MVGYALCRILWSKFRFVVKNKSKKQNINFRYLLLCFYIQALLLWSRFIRLNEPAQPKGFPLGDAGSFNLINLAEQNFHRKIVSTYATQRNGFKDFIKVASLFLYFH